MKRNATAVWTGSGKEGKGVLSTQSKTLSQVAYDFRSRFEDGSYTNPEELIAAAHAGCFAMKLSFVLGAAGFVPDSLEATSTLTLESGSITSSEIVLRAKVSGIDEATFQKCATEAKEQCPVSKALNMQISLNAQLV
jgi:osmotically inducible protein OsmC